MAATGSKVLGLGLRPPNPCRPFDGHGVAGTALKGPFQRRNDRATAGFSTGPRPRKERLLILGSGWGGYNLARAVDKSRYNVGLMSPSNHFVFTPLLPSTAVGTLEFRCIQEPVRRLEGVSYDQAKARSIDVVRGTVQAEDIFPHSRGGFEQPFDKLVIAVGCKTNTFHTPGVLEREGREVFFLKHLYHARQIRSRTVDCFERADIPGTPEAEIDRLLHFVVVGGGPTSCEFTAELHDFLKEDISKLYPQLASRARVTLIETGKELSPVEFAASLGSFQRALRQHAQRSLEKRKINVLTEVAMQGVEEVEREGFRAPSTEAVLSNGQHLPFGMMVWSAGLAPVKLTEALDGFPKSPNGRILVDEHLQVPGYEGKVWAIGDCAVSQTQPLAPIAQVAQQQAQYLAAGFNGVGSGEFHFFQRGAMAQLGLGKGVMDLSQLGDPHSTKDRSSIPEKLSALSGPLAWLTWRFAYWGKQVSIANKILIPMHWFKTFVFGRDISRF